MIAVQTNGKTVAQAATMDEAEGMRPAHTVRTVRVPGRVVNHVTETEDEYYERMADEQADYAALVDAATESVWEKMNLR